MGGATFVAITGLLRTSYISWGTIGNTTAKTASEKLQSSGPGEDRVSKVQHKKFRAMLEYQVEVTEDFQPTEKEELFNLRQLIKTDPEIVKPKLSLIEVE